MRQVVNGKLYYTEKAQLVAHDRIGMGATGTGTGETATSIRPGRQLLCLPSNILAGRTRQDSTVTESEARRWYETLAEHEMEYEEAFGGASEEA